MVEERLSLGGGGGCHGGGVGGGGAFAGFAGHSFLQSIASENPKERTLRSEIISRGAEIIPSRRRCPFLDIPFGYGRGKIPIRK